MARTRPTSGSNAQFTYDFGIAIAQSTVNKLTRLTGATLTLASAYYALKTSAAEYVETVKENTLRFGGVLSTMRAIEDAQKRILKGSSYSSVEDQLQGMNRLMAVGIKVEDEINWINKAAHASGKSFAEFSGIIASAIQGNAQALVDAGLMTQRATRMFDKYAANTVMRQQAILNFVKTHKGLANAIKNDFETIQDQILRIKENWRAFLQSIVGKPNDPQSFYGQIVSSLKMVAVSLSSNAEKIKKYGFVIGQTLGWVIKQIGHFVVWIGRKVNSAVSSIWKLTDDYAERTRSMLVWLEFWKVKVVDFFKEYSWAIKGLLKMLIAYKALKTVFFISNAAIASVIRYRNILASVFALQKRYLVFMGPAIGNKFTRWLQSLAVFMPRWLRRIWVSVGKMIESAIFGGGISRFFKWLFASLFGLKPVLAFLGKTAKFIFGLIKNIPVLFMAIVRAGKVLIATLLGTNPIGWIVLAIGFLTVLYTKSEKFRIFINSMFKVIVEYIKFIWNLFATGVTYVLVGIKKIGKWFKDYVWSPISNFFGLVGGWISDMWNKFKDSTVGRWIDKYIVSPLKSVFQWIIDAWKWVMGGVKSVLDWLTGANDKLSQNAAKIAETYGVAQIPTFSGGNYDTSDSTNYLNPTNWSPDSNAAVPAPAENPLIVPNQNTTNSSVASSMTFTEGSIKIVVEKGENIDEDKLAAKIKQVIKDLQRENNVRGGTI